MRQRLIDFDIAKAICIVLVVIGHYAPTGMPYFHQIIHDWIYIFHMPFFMFASGYIYIANKCDCSYSSFILKKIKRLIIPYLVTSFIIISIKLMTPLGMSIENPVSYFSYIRMLYYPEAGYFLWFVWALFIIFCIIPLFKTKYTRLVLFIFAVLWHYKQPYTLTEIVCIRQACKMLVWFMLGVICFDWKDQINRNFPKGRILKYTILLGSGTFIALSILLFFGYGNNIMIMPWLGIVAIMGISKWLSQFANKKWMNTFFVLSSSNYIIYLFHTTFMGISKGIIYKIINLPNMNSLSYTCCTLIIIATGILFPIILHKFFLEKSKTTAFLFGLK